MKRIFRDTRETALTKFRSCDKSFRPLRILSSRGGLTPGHPPTAVTSNIDPSEVETLPLALPTGCRDRTRLLPAVMRSVAHPLLRGIFALTRGWTSVCLTVGKYLRNPPHPTPSTNRRTAARQKPHACSPWRSCGHHDSSKQEL